MLFSFAMFKRYLRVVCVICESRWIMPFGVKMRHSQAIVSISPRCPDSRLYRLIMLLKLYYRCWLATSWSVTALAPHLIVDVASLRSYVAFIRAVHLKERSGSIIC